MIRGAACFCIDIREGCLINYLRYLLSNIWIRSNVRSFVLRSTESDMHSDWYTCELSVVMQHENIKKHKNMGKK
jgi:hypothetical protein